MISPDTGSCASDHLSHCVVLSDFVTPTPVLHAPKSHQVMVMAGGAFNFTFELKSDALPSSVQIVIQTAAESAVVDPVATRMITFGSAFERAGVHSIVTSRLADAATEFGAQTVVSVVPASNLVTGSMYSVTIRYADKTANPISQATANDIFYSTCEPAA